MISQQTMSRPRYLGGMQSQIWQRRLCDSHSPFSEQRLVPVHSITVLLFVLPFPSLASQLFAIHNLLAC